MFLERVSKFSFYGTDDEKCPSHIFEMRTGILYAVLLSVYNKWTYLKSRAARVIKFDSVKQGRYKIMIYQALITS